MQNSAQDWRELGEVIRQHPERDTRSKLVDVSISQPKAVAKASPYGSIDDIGFTYTHSHYSESYTVMQTDRQTDRQTGRQTDRQAGRQTETLNTRTCMNVHMLTNACTHVHTLLVMCNMKYFIFYIIAYHDYCTPNL